MDIFRDAARPKYRASKVKLKAKVPAVGPKTPQSPPKFPSSPLPPSSPFASSSSQIFQYSLPAASSEPFFSDQKKEKPFYARVEVEEDRDFDSDVYGMMEDDCDAKRDIVFSTRNPDPFGFFAMEAKLKAKRTQDSGTTSKMAPVLIVSQPLKPPRSPHKQRIGKRPSASLARGCSPSLPSSPSPAKRRRVTKSDFAGEIIDNSDGTEREPGKNDGNSHAVQFEGASRKRAKTKVGGRRDKTHVDKPVDPKKLARDLTALLPKRAAQSNIKPRQGRTKVDSDCEEADGHRHTRRSANRGKRANKTIGYDASDNEQITERQKRIEYFKKLESYEVAKENVYVI
ncbi:hypothetical protein GYMLUDRAFT_35053 [Collybiopsis luxurians FD-317 M1]|nr:hypothetical protein GYMLUDRAFT_35053 [Collybiopsis luxurians FD-317 M1]